MRWQRQSDFDSFASGNWPRGWRRIMPSVAVSLCLLASAILVLAPTPAPAEGELIEAGDVVDIGDAGGASGMPATNPRVKSLLAAHPAEFVTICVAGCAGKPSIVQMLPKPIPSRRGEMRTTAGTMDGLNGAHPVYPVGFGVADANAVTCVAGCGGPPGQIIQNLPGLPAPSKASARKAAEADKGVEAGNEPLDVGH
jgi:hypothetical protein